MPSLSIEELQEGRMIETGRKTIVTLCGSTRFIDLFHDWNLNLTLAGYIVLSIGCDTKTDTEIFQNLTPEELEEIRNLIQQKKGMR